MHDTNLKKKEDLGEDVDRCGGSGVDGDEYDDIKMNKKPYNPTTRKLPDYDCVRIVSYSETTQR